MQRAATETKAIIESPYDPFLWLQRGKTLHVLSYPELAFGDAYKARLLVDMVFGRASQAVDSTEIGKAAFETSVKRVFANKDPDTVKATIAGPKDLKFEAEKMLKTIEEGAWKLMITALISTKAIHDPYGLCEQAVKKFPKVPCFKEKLDELEKTPYMEGRRKALLAAMLETLHEEKSADLDGKDGLSDAEFNRIMAAVDAKYRKVPGNENRRLEMQDQTGAIKIRPYPWMTTEMLTRDLQSLASLNSERGKAATQTCEFRYSSIQDRLSVAADDASANRQIGVFAKKDIKPGDLIFTETTTTSYINASNRCDACRAKMPSDQSSIVWCSDVFFCNAECRKRARDVYHRVACEKYFKFRHTGQWDVPTHLDIRILATLIQENAEHPLTGSFLRRYDAAYSKHTIALNLHHMVENSACILQTLGVDIFKDLRYDTWVLLTMRFRMFNNMHQFSFPKELGSHVLITIPRLAFLFNHSCEPNVERKHVGGSAKEVFTAMREVKKGEELYVDYWMEVGDFGKGDRRLELGFILHVDCQCKKCVTEEVRDLFAKAGVACPPQ